MQENFYLAVRQGSFGWVCVWELNREAVAVLAAASAIVEFLFDFRLSLRRDEGHAPSLIISCHLPTNWIKSRKSCQCSLLVLATKYLCRFGHHVAKKKLSLGMERLSLKKVSGEGLEGGLLYWGPWQICKERLLIRASLFTWVPLRLRGTWNLEGGSYTGTVKDEWRRALGTGHLSQRDPMTGTWREGSFTGDRERHIK